MEGVGETEVGEGVGLQHVGIIAGVVQILLADELGDEGDVEILNRREGEVVANDDAGRIGDRRVAEMLLHIAIIIPILIIIRHIVDVIQHSVDTEAAIYMPSEETDRTIGCGELDAGTVALIDIGHEGITGLIQFTGTHELVTVVHAIQRGVEEELVVVHGVAELHVVQGLRHWLAVIGGTDKVVAGRFAVGGGKREVEGMFQLALGQIVVQRNLWVDEVPVVFLRNGHQLVVDTFNGVIHPAVLQFARDAEVLVPVAQVGKELALQLVARSTVPLVQGRALHYAVGLNPNDVAIVFAVVVADIHTGHPAQPLVSMVFEHLCARILRMNAIIIVVEILLGDQVGFCHRVIQRVDRVGSAVKCMTNDMDEALQTVFAHLLVVLILLIITDSAGQIGHHLQAMVLQTVLADPVFDILQLIEGLCVVIFGVLIIMILLVSIIVFAAGVIGTVGLQHIVWHAVPGKAGMFSAKEHMESQLTVIFVLFEVIKIVLGSQEAGVEAHARIVNVAIAANIGEGGQHGEALADKASAGTDHIVERVKGTVGASHFCKGLGGYLPGDEIHTGTIGSTTVVGVGATLHTHMLDEGGHIGQVHQPGALRLGIVDGDSVEGGVDTGLVNATDEEIGGAKAVTRFGGGDHRGHHFQKVVDTSVTLLGPDLGHRHGRDVRRGLHSGFSELDGHLVKFAVLCRIQQLGEQSCWKKQQQEIEN